MDINLQGSRAEEPGPSDHPAPDRPLIVDGLDWSWAFVRFEAIRGRPDYCAGIDGSIWSCAGQIRHADGDTIISGRWHMLKPSTTPKGYLYVRIGRHKHCLVHRLILETFIGPCPPGLECRHLDGNRANNRLGNLVWGTPEQNTDDRVRHGRSFRGEENHRARLTEADVVEVLARSRAGENGAAIARSLGADPNTISDILRGWSWNHVTKLPCCRPSRRRSGITAK